MNRALDALIAVFLTQSLNHAYAPPMPYKTSKAGAMLLPISSYEPKVAEEYGASRKLFVIRGKVCDTSAACLVLKASYANKALEEKGE